MKLPSLHPVLYFFLTVIGLTGCKVMQPSHNESVQQPVIRETDHGRSVIVKAGAIYKSGKFKRFLLGDHYRNLWTTPVEVPVLELDQEKGGLHILDKGGGQQTYSLKLKGGDGHLYSLRSVQKDPTPALPLPLQYSFADDIVQDQISASHPYGAYVLPYLGDKAGIYHTNPKLYYLPDTAELGKYRKKFGGSLVMLEEDADEDWSDYEDFGNTKNAVSSETVLEDLLEDNDHQVDQESYLRARLFDIWIGDWDRHKGQFRWAEIEKKDRTFYRPIPEDRDNVFFRFDGVIPWVASRKWALRKFQDFQPEIRDMAGLNFNARHNDRRFLSEMERSDWIHIAEDLQTRLTNEVIRTAMQQLPDTIRAINGKELSNILEARKYKLRDFAERYYEILAHEVDIVGTNKSELFEVSRMLNGDTEVHVFDSNEDGERKDQLYFRTFHKDETREVRLYGMGDVDHFVISGVSQGSTRIRVIGGEGEDVYQDSSTDRGWQNKNIYYDTEDGNSVEAEKETRTVFTDNRHIVRYDMDAFEYNVLMPLINVGFNTDDKFFFGGGAKYTTYGFNRFPYETQQNLQLAYSPHRKSLEVKYEGDFTNMVGEMGINVSSVVRSPNYFTNFYGFGNTTTVTEDDEYYEAFYNEFRFFPGLTQRNHNTLIKFGPKFEQFDVRRNDGSYLADHSDEFSTDLYEQNRFVGAGVEIDLKTVEDLRYPENGIHWVSSLSWLGQINNNKSKYSQLTTELSGYYTFEEPLKITLAVRIGGAINSGDYAFYQANTIGGNRGFQAAGNVRGLDRDRFSGRSSAFQNFEVRARLIRLPFYYMPMEIGASVFVDNGRVWNAGEVPEGNDWHTSYGEGLWFRPLGMLTFTLYHADSEEDDLWNLNIGFMF